MKHPYFETYRQRDRRLFKEKQAEELKKRPKPVRGRILEAVASRK